MQGRIPGALVLKIGAVTVLCWASATSVEAQVQAPVADPSGVIGAITRDVLHDERVVGIHHAGRNRSSRSTKFNRGFTRIHADQTF